jgi:hypothetical protein
MNSAADAQSPLNHKPAFGGCPMSGPMNSATSHAGRNISVDSQAVHWWLPVTSAQHHRFASQPSAVAASSCSEAAFEYSFKWQQSETTRMQLRELSEARALQTVGKVAA